MDKNPMEREVRTLPINLELRRDGQNNPVVYGRCAVYNSRSENLGGFTEIIEPGFFSGCLENDIVATVEHDNRLLVGRSTSGTLKVTDSADALTTKNTLPPTTVGNDLRVLIERGDIKGMSFAFRVKSGGDKWEEDPTTGATTRTLLNGGCERIYDVTYTCNPAYRDTSIAMRSMEQFRESNKKTEEQGKEYDPATDAAMIEKKRRIKLALCK